MNEFTASNGVTVANHGGNWDMTTMHFESDRFPDASERDVLLEDCDLVALRELFQHERDEALGRWRWPENPDYVVYPRPGFDHFVRVVNERSALSEVIYREGVEGRGSLAAQAARAYFDAHPVRKPWHDAKTGEGWIITLDGREQMALVDSVGDLIVDGEDLTMDEETDARITAGRRIWPEDPA